LNPKSPSQAGSRRQVPACRSSTPLDGVGVGVEDVHHRRGRNVDDACIQYGHERPDEGNENRREPMVPRLTYLSGALYEGFPYAKLYDHAIVNAWPKMHLYKVLSRTPSTTLSDFRSDVAARGRQFFVTMALFRQRKRRRWRVAKGWYRGQLAKIQARDDR